MSKASKILGVNSAALVLAITTTLLRCFVRIRLIKAFGLDDWLMTAATVCLLSYGFGNENALTQISTHFRSVFASIVHSRSRVSDTERADTHTNSPMNKLQRQRR